MDKASTEQHDLMVAFARIFEEIVPVTNLEIENGVTNIGNCAFYNCLNLTSISIPNIVHHFHSFSS